MVLFMMGVDQVETQDRMKSQHDDPLTVFDFALLVVIGITYPFIASCLLFKWDIIAYAIPCAIFAVATVVTFCALRDFWAFYREQKIDLKK